MDEEVGRFTPPAPGVRLMFLAHSGPPRGRHVPSGRYQISVCGLLGIALRTRCTCARGLGPVTFGGGRRGAGGGAWLTE